MQIRIADFPSDTHALKALINEYVAWLDIDMGFQDFDDEMAQLDTKYSLPNGQFWLALQHGQLVACIGFRRLDHNTAEVKRLYVQPAYRGQQIGEKLLRSVIKTTSGLGYKQLVLDTVPKTAGSHKLYLQLGFKPIAPYASGPTLATGFFGLTLPSV
jgi:putative acetyltransferase